MKKLLLLTLLFAVLWVAPAMAQAGPTYFYVATAVDANGFESAFSNQISATFNQGQKTVSLSWTAAVVPTGGAAIAGYNIYRAKFTGVAPVFVKVNTALITGVTFADSFTLPNVPSGLAGQVS